MSSGFKTKEITYEPQSKSRKWRFLFFSVLALFVLGGIFYVAFSGGGSEAKHDTGPTSSIPAPPKMDRTVVSKAGTKVSPQYAESTRNYNAQQSQEALKETKSNIPLPTPDDIETGTARSLRDVNAKPPVDLKQAAAAKTKPVSQVERQSKYLLGLMKTWSLDGMDVMAASAAPGSKTTQDVSAQAVPTLATAEGNQPGAKGAKTSSNSRAPTPIIQAGDILYAEAQTAANSDVPGPILFDLIGTKLGKASLVGTYERKGNYLDINITLLVLKGKPAIPVHAKALSIEGDPGIRDSINHRYIERYGLPAFAKLVEGFGNAASRVTHSITIGPAGTTEVQDQNLTPRQQLLAGAAASAGALAKDLDAAASNVQPLVRLDRNSGAAIFFLSDVYQSETRP